MESYSEAHVLEEALTVRERWVRESSDNKNHNGFLQSRNQSPQIYLLPKREGRTAKRVIDLMVGSIGFLALALLYPFISLGIKLSSRGPVIYRQKRTGINGKEFICYKFRTMHPLQLSRIDGKPVVTRRKDWRIFTFGRLLRKTNLDELPQIINVLKGDMSLVGPRPYPVQECAYWNSRFEDFYYRYSVKPGISGLAQVKGYRGGTLDEEHMRKRLDYDLIYVEKSKARMDIRIIWKTILQMASMNTKAH